MKILIAEDDFTSPKVLQQYLKPYGDADVAVNGTEVIAAFVESIRNDAPYELICLDIMMPEMDGQTALKRIRDIEAENGIQYPNSARILSAGRLQI